MVVTEGTLLLSQFLLFVLHLPLIIRKGILGFLRRLPLLHLIVLVPLSLLMLIPSLVWTQAWPSPSVEEFEMGSSGTPAAKGRVVDTTVLAQFKEEYDAAQEAPKPVFAKYLPLVGAAALLDVLEETYPACHAQAHDLGKALFAAHQDLGPALRACGMRCTSGCMHGAVAEAFGNSTLAAITAQMNTFCDHGEMARLHKPGNCAHALGHALMFVTGGDVRQSVDACLGFAHEAMRYYCATGVYMEKLLPAHPRRHRRPRGFPHATRRRSFRPPAIATRRSSCSIASIVSRNSRMSAYGLRPHNAAAVSTGSVTR